MLTLDRPAASAAPQAEPSRSTLTTRDRRLIASLIEPGAKIAHTDEPAVDPALRRWMPAVVPMLAVLISGCILAIWSIL